MQKTKICNLYKRNNSSNGVKCAQEIDHFTEIKSASPLSYHVFAGSNFKVDIVRIHDLQCLCRKFDFSQTLNMHFFSLGKALLELTGFMMLHEWWIHILLPSQIMLYRLRKKVDLIFRYQHGNCVRHLVLLLQWYFNQHALIGKEKRI